MRDERFTISIIGLGLMGGSFAYALHGFRDCLIVGYDADPGTMSKAAGNGAIDIAAESAEYALDRADLTMFCVSPSIIIDYIRNYRQCFKKGSVITDICGVKNEVAACFAGITEDGLDYVGLHPMAGKEVGGFDNADPGIFKGAGFIIIPPERHNQCSVELLKELSTYAGAGRICVNTAAEHDRIIAYTSDMMHISATALCAGRCEGMTMAHTAGAFRDCTRIADIDAGLWTDLFFKNADNIVLELDRYIADLMGFSTALKNGDTAFIHSFLSRACANKKEMQTL